ncbi:MAG: hypothetical protein H7Z41_00470 [Cytophagales bacterium]|nr:hypothetical protein [Armatimonadota bacterium]
MNPKATPPNTPRTRRVWRYPAGEDAWRHQGNLPGDAELTADGAPSIESGPPGAEADFPAGAVALPSVLSRYPLAADAHPV